MFYDFKVERDVSLIENFDWGREVEGALPFGGGCKIRRSKLTAVQVVNRSVRLVVPEDSTAEWVTERCVEERFGECLVSGVGEGQPHPLLIRHR